MSNPVPTEKVIETLSDFVCVPLNKHRFNAVEKPTERRQMQNIHLRSLKALQAAAFHHVNLNWLHTMIEVHSLQDYGVVHISRIWT